MSLGGKDTWSGNGIKKPGAIKMRVSSFAALPGIG